MNMATKILDKQYWETRYQDGATGWDIGSASLPIKEYIDQLDDKTIKILIPGCGKAWEGEYLYQLGFKNVFLIDVAAQALLNFEKRVPSFPRNQIIEGDFFEFDGSFDLIFEQTFFCAIDPDKRKQYVAKAWSLLKPQGKLVGVLFDHEFGNAAPPFGGTKAEYLSYFDPWFRIKYFDTAYNSIAPRNGKELFINLIKR